MSMRRVDGSSFHLFFVLLPCFLFQSLIFLLLFRGEHGVNPWLKCLVDFFQFALLLIPRQRVFLPYSLHLLAFSIRIGLSFATYA